MAKKADVRDLEKELAKLNNQADRALETRNPQLLESTRGNIAVLSDALNKARTGEMDVTSQWLRDNAKSLNRSQKIVDRATKKATRRTPLTTDLRSEAREALRDPTAGNAVLENLVNTSGPSELLTTMTDQAQRGLDDDGQLTAEEARLATQGARAAFSARGLGNSSASAMAEVLGRTEYVTGRQDRARTYAAGAETLGQQSRAGDLNVANTVEGAIERGRNFGLNVNAQDMTKQQLDLAAKTGRADYGLKTDPALIAHGTPSMVPGALSAATATTSQADVYPQILQYGSELNQFNTNMLESRYLNELNAKYANEAGARMAGASSDAASASTTSAAIAGGAMVAAAAAVCWLAREVFGPESMRWIEYREWLRTAAPASWFRKYQIHARRWAALCRTNSRARTAFTNLLINQLTGESGFHKGHHHALRTCH